MKTQNPIQIFKAGKHTASSGVALTFSETDLEACANAYDPAIHEAPIVIGHPKTDLPAYGWVKSLAFSESGLLDAHPHQVNVDFAEMVNNGAFKKVSASFYTPDSKNNPVPGVYYLKHVGFLGAEAPAIKGLRQASFSESEEGVIEFNEIAFSGYNTLTVARILRRIREWLLVEKGQEVADTVLPDYELSGMETSAAYEIAEDQLEKNPDLTLSNYSEDTGDQMKPEDQAKLDALEAENKALKQQQADFAEQQNKTRIETLQASNLAFAEGLVKTGQLIPAQKDVLVAALNFVAAPTEVVEFGEGETKKPLLDSLKDALLLNPKVVEFGEHQGGAEGLLNVKDDADALAKRAVEFAESEAAAGRTVNAAQAVSHVVGQMSK